MCRTANKDGFAHGLSKNGGYDAVPIGRDEIRALVEDGKALVKGQPRLTPGTYTR